MNVKFFFKKDTCILTNFSWFDKRKCERWCFIMDFSPLNRRLQDFSIHLNGRISFFSRRLNSWNKLISIEVTLVFKWKTKKVKFHLKITAVKCQMMWSPICYIHKSFAAFCIEAFERSTVFYLHVMIKIRFWVVFYATQVTYERYLGFVFLVKFFHMPTKTNVTVEQSLTNKTVKVANFSCFLMCFSQMILHSCLIFENFFT